MYIRQQNGVYNTMKSVILEIVGAYPNDYGKGIIRLDPDTLLTLKLAPGDYVKISNKSKETAACVWRADRPDWNQSIARLDFYNRDSINISIGDTAKIEPTQLVEADKITLKMPDVDKRILRKINIERFIINQHIKRAVSQNDLLPLNILHKNREGKVTEEHFINGSAKIINTKPQGIVKITNQTDIRIIDDIDKNLDDYLDLGEKASEFDIK